MKNLSFWEREILESPADIIIVGGGLTGMLTALNLTGHMPGLDIRIYESQVLSRHAASKNAGFLCFGSPTEILADVEQMGKAAAIDLVMRRCAGIDKLMKWVRPGAIDYDPCGGYELIPEAQIDQLPIQDLNEWLSDIDPHVFTIAESPFAGYALVSNPHEAVIHPGKLVATLKQRCMAAGISIIEGATVHRVEPACIMLSENMRVRSRCIVIATNALLGDLLPDADVRPARNEVYVVRPAGKHALNGAYHVNEGYVYFRHLGEYILIGGGRDRVGERAITRDAGSHPEVKEYLFSLLADTIIPGQSFTEVAAWSGIIGIGNSGKLPIVEKIDDGIFAVGRMSGMGVALSADVGEKMAELVANEVK